jgi:predicted nucleic acid-binding protein
MSHFKVIYDACVFYPAPLRDLLIQLAISELYRAKWSNRIHEEWIRNLLKRRPDLSFENLERTRKLIDGAVMDSLVEGFEDIESSLNLPDPDDNHVLAAAIVSGCNVIVTFNLKDFPQTEIGKYNIEAQHPDDFFMYLTDLNKNKFLSAVRAVRLRLKNPPKSIDEYLETLQIQNVPKTVIFLEKHASYL